MPGYNDAPDDLRRLRNFLGEIGARSVDVLPYHNLGERKLDLTGMAGGGLPLVSMSQADAAERTSLLKYEGCMMTVHGEQLSKPAIDEVMGNAS